MAAAMSSRSCSPTARSLASTSCARVRTAVGRDDTLSMFAKKVAEFVPFTTCVVYLLDSSKFAMPHTPRVPRRSARSRRIKTVQEPRLVLKSGELARTLIRIWT